MLAKEVTKLFLNYDRNSEPYLEIADSFFYNQL